MNESKRSRGPLPPTCRSGDSGEFDAFAHHLVVEERATGAIVGTYRFMTKPQADARGGFYSETEFDFRDLPRDVLERGAEIGRACVAAEHRNGRVIHLRWKVDSEVDAEVDAGIDAGPPSAPRPLVPLSTSTVDEVRADPAGDRTGRAYLFLGSETGLGSEPLVLDGSAAGDWFGNSVRNLGDVNGDGYSDFAVGAFFANPGGRMTAGTLSVYLGGSGGPSIVPFIVHEGAAAGDRFGISANGGDFDGDGFDDLVVGAINADSSGLTNAGAAVVYDRVSTLKQVIAGNAAFLGFGLGGVAYFNGDGRADLAVGARGADPSGQMNAGGVWVYLGSMTGIVEPARFIFLGSAPNEELGSIAP